MLQQHAIVIIANIALECCTKVVGKMVLRYNLSYKVWQLLNPKGFAGSIPAILILHTVDIGYSSTIHTWDQSSVQCRDFLGNFCIIWGLN